LTPASRLIVIFSVLSLAPFETSCRKADIRPIAWNDARWGMNESEVSEAFKGRVASLPPDKAARAENGNSAQTVLRIGEFDIDGRKFSVQFLFNSGHKLETVHLSLLSDNRYIIDTAFKDLEAKLTEKYGLAAFKSDDDSLGQSLLFKGALHSTRGWKLPATTIELTYSRTSANGERHVAIRYISNEARRSTTAL
jgi:hypothetical protein